VCSDAPVARVADAGWLKEIRAKSGAPVWRTDEETGTAYSLKLTNVGLKVIAANDMAGSRSDSTPEAPGGDESDDEKKTPAPKSDALDGTAVRSNFREGSKIAEAVKLLRREGGGTIDELSAAMNWLAAAEVERFVLEAIARVRPMRNLPVQNASRSAKGVENGDASNLAADEDNATMRARFGRVTLFVQSIDIEFSASEVDPAERISIPWTPQTFRRKREVIAPTSQGIGDLQSIRWEARTRLVSAIAKARRWLDEIVWGKTAGIEAIAAREGLNERSARMTLSLAFLAPDIIKAAVDGNLPRGLGLSRFTDLPASWSKQRRATGLSSSP
jgi:hypothetical protein